MILAAALFAVSGCGSKPAPQGEVPLGGDAGAPGQPDAGAPPPVQVTLQLALDPAHAASALLTADGGTISATGADGTRFTLVVLPDALFGEETVTLTPVASAAGLPLSGGLVGAVQLEPEGLRLQELAQLTIEPAGSLQGKAIHAFGYEGGGTEFDLRPARAQGSAFTLGLMHFSGGGLGEGTVAPYVPASGDEAVALRRLFDLEEFDKVPTTADLSSVFGDWLSAVIARLGGVVEGLDAAIDDFSSWKAHLAEYPGLDAIYNDARRKTEALLVAQVARAINDAALQCKTQSDVTHAFDILRWVLRVQKLGLGDSLAASAWAQVDACVRFELTLTSNNVVNEDTPLVRQVYKTSVLSVVKLTLDRSQGVALSLRGHAPLSVQDVSGTCTPKGAGLVSCSDKMVAQSGTFTVASSTFGVDVSRPAHQPPTHLELRVHAESGDIAGTVETTLITDDGSTSTVPPLPTMLWYPGFYYAHSAERFGTDFDIREWQVTGGADFATKTYTNLAPPPLEFLTITEPETKLVLRHTPQ